MSLKSIFEEKKATQERLMELEIAVQNQKTIALQEIKKIVEENCITYKDLLMILNELKLVQSSQRELLVHNQRKYYDPINNRSWDGGYYVPAWVQENIGKLDDWLTTDESGRNHTKTALRLMGRSESAAVSITAERSTDNNWIHQTSQIFNELFDDKNFGVFKEKYSVLNESNQAAIFASLDKKIQDFISNDFNL